jgi:IS30 family transposase
MNDIDAALAALEPGVPVDYTKLAEELGVHRSTVSRRHRGKTTSRTDYRENASLLSNEQQKQLIRHINKLTERGLPINHQNFRVFARDLCGK